MEQIPKQMHDQPDGKVSHGPGARTPETLNGLIEFRSPGSPMHLKLRNRAFTKTLNSKP